METALKIFLANLLNFEEKFWVFEHKSFLNDKKFTLILKIALILSYLVLIKVVCYCYDKIARCIRRIYGK